MKKIIIATDPSCLVGDQHISEFSKTGASKRRVHSSTLIGYTIVGVESNEQGEIVLSLRKKNQIPHQTEDLSASS
jgi:hypothetical protein